MLWFVLMLVPALGQPAGDERPLLGITMVAVGEETEVGQQSFERGIQIQSVVPDSSAAAAGLLAGDVIVAVAGVDLDCTTEELVPRFGEAIRSRRIGDTLTLTVVRDTTIQRAQINGETVEQPDAWEKVQEHLKAAEPGSVIEFHAECVRELLTLTARLGARPAALDALLKTFGPNDEMFPEPVAHLPAERLIEALVEEFAIAEEYRDQRQRLAQLVAQPDWYCLSGVAYVMREPFALPELSRRLSDVPETLPVLLTHAGTWLDLPPPPEATTRLETGLSAEEHARQIEGVLARAHASCAQAFAALSPQERTFLDETLDLMADALRDDIMIQRDPDRQRLGKVVRLAQLAPRVERAKVIEAALHIASLTDPQYLAGLQKDLAGRGDGVFLTHKTEFGDIVFAGVGDTWFQQSAAVIVDLGGNDFYTNPTQHRVTVVIDLGGDDEHAATFPRAQGCAALGVSLLYDHAGNDMYRARRWGQGSGVFGVGVLHDHAGNDSYRAGDYAQAAAFCGVGLLIDDAGDDRYHAERFGQALALPGGFAALIDRGGDDHYYCKGRDLGAYGTPGIFAGWGQGCGVGLRGVASGGVALLLDESGDDVYEAGNFSQGNGYYYGWGCLVDRAGDDRYLGSRYAQASAAHQAISYLEDHAGDDVYLARRGVGQSCSWDLTVTTLIDRAGNDSYSAGGFALGAAAHNGLAIFVDAAGRDRYEKNSGKARAGGNDYHGGTSLSLILDLGGRQDVYAGKTNANNTIRKNQQHGFFADVPGDLDDALEYFREWIER